MIEANRKLHEHAWCIAEVAPVVSVNTITTSTTDLTSAYTNGTDTGLAEATNGVDFEFVENDRDFMEDQLKQSKSIIEDNINLRIRWSHFT